MPPADLKKSVRHFMLDMTLVVTTVIIKGTRFMMWHEKAYQNDSRLSIKISVIRKYEYFL